MTEYDEYDDDDGDDPNPVMLSLIRGLVQIHP